MPMEREWVDGDGMYRDRDRARAREESLSLCVSLPATSFRHPGKYGGGGPLSSHRVTAEGWYHMEKKQGRGGWLALFTLFDARWLLRQREGDLPGWPAAPQKRKERRHTRMGRRSLDQLLTSSLYSIET